MPEQAEKRALQSVVMVLALIPVSAGLAGICLGPGFLKLDGPPSPELDSHFRFLSGIFLAIGIGWWTCIPRIETKTLRFRFLALLVVSGGAARLLSLLIAGPPAIWHLAGLGMELIAVPLLVVWQGRVAHRP